MKKVFLMLVIFFCFGVTVYAEDSNLTNSDRESDVIDNNSSNANSNDNVNSNSNSYDNSDLDTSADSDTTNGSDNDKSTSDSNSGNGVNLASNAKSAIMIEASTGKVIFEKNANED